MHVKFGWHDNRPLAPIVICTSPHHAETDLRTDFEYDVAFSFNALDEGVATQVNDLLAPRLKTFIYSERQREIAGTDGQETFSAVYGKAARLVVVMFRPEWGQTPWTRIERDAIKNRSLEDGWDFCTFVPTVERPEMPPWLPKTRLYVGLGRWGMEAAAAVIEARATELGSNPVEETVSDRADRFARAAKLKSLQKNFQNTSEGVNAASKSFQAFAAKLEELCQAISGKGVRVQYQNSRGYHVLTGLVPCNAIAEFRSRFSNTLDEAVFEFTVYKGFPEIAGNYGSFEKARKLTTLRFTYQLLSADHHAWVEKGGTRNFSGEQLADYVLRTYMDVAERTSQ